MPLTDELRELAARVSNWGRWGDDDERGTQNLIDPAATRRGLASVQSGHAISLAIPLDQDGPQRPGGAPNRIDPVHRMIAVNETYTGNTSDACFNDDEVTLSLASGTHIDSLAHVTYDELMYNGYPASIVTESGTPKCGADKLGPIATRGVLLDLPAVQGVTRLEPGYAITGDDLDAAAEQAQTTVQPGDALLVRTGQMQLLHEREVEGYNHDTPGLSIHTIEWLHRHDVAAAFTDTYVYEVWPPEDWDCMVPVHMIHLRDMGFIQGQNWDLEALAEACAADGRYTFLLNASPEPFTGALSAPVAPVALR